MKKKDIRKVAKASDDIWNLLKVSVMEKNWALLETNLARLASLHDYTNDLLFFQETEISILEADNKYLSSKVDELMTEQLLDLARKDGTYKALKKRIDETFKEKA